MINEEDRLAIRQAVSRLHERGSSNYNDLLSQVEKKYSIIHLNAPQVVASFSQAKTLVLEWGRGTGKTTIIGNRLHKLQKQMPRSSGLLIAPTYQMTLTRILPALIQGLEMFGLYENLHYFIAQQPPRSWRSSWGRAYQPPRNYDHYVTFFNGMGAHLISQDVAGDGRALSTDWIIGMEAAMLSNDKLQENTDPTLRGTNTGEFRNAPLFGSKMYESSTPITPEGIWLLDYEAKAMANPKKFNFISADCRDNLHNLRPGFLEEAKQNAITEWLFEAEYLNKRPAMVKDGFYPLLSADIHAYESFNYNHYDKVGTKADCRGDSDLSPNHPLIVAVDWGAAINCLSVNQHLQAVNEYRTLNSMYVLGTEQKIQDDLFADFHKYYQHHQQNNADIYLWYDASGNNNTGISKQTRAQLAQTQLNKLGWKVHLMTVGGSNPRHDQKHMLWNQILAEKSQAFPRYRINKSNARALWVSMTNAGTVKNRDGTTGKNKSSEKKSSVPRQFATDLSDANDTPIFGLFYNRLRFGASSIALPETSASIR